MDIFLLCIEIILALSGLGIIYRLFRRLYARHKVKKTSVEEKEKVINEYIDEAGFLLDAENDYIYSKVDAWQKNVGYCKLYDQMAPLFRMMIDCEPVYFPYGGKIYLVEFWKGQYGMATGAEVGIYSESREEVEKAGGYEKAFYHCLEDYKGFYLYYQLFNREGTLVERSDRHWWLTIFKLGLFSKAEDLFMETEIMFPNASMSYAFYQGLLRAGYAADEINYSRNIVGFTYDRVRSKQIQILKPIRSYINMRNKRYINIYTKYTKKYITTVDKLFYLKYCFPRVFKAALNLGRSVKFFRRVAHDISK